MQCLEELVLPYTYIITLLILFFSPLTGSYIFQPFSLDFLIGWMHLKYKQRVDSVIAAVWSIGMAIGVILISITPGSNAELMNFLFGNLLWASHREILSFRGA